MPHSLGAVPGAVPGRSVDQLDEVLLPELDEERPHVVRLAVEHLFHEVVEDEAVAAGERVDELTDLAAAVLEATGRVIVFTTDAVIQLEVSPLASYAVGKLYSYPNYGGSSITVTAANPCSAGYSHDYTNLGTIGWNDDIDSFQSFNGCQTKVWENTGFTGATYGYITNSTDLGSMRNRASSIKWQ